MKLYLTPNACSFAVDVVARELGIPLQLEWIDVRAKRLKDGSDYLRINPKGQVPALEMNNGQFLSEGPVIMQLLAESVAPNSLLPPAGTLERYRVLEWLNFVTSELHKGFTPLFRANTPAEYRTIAIEALNKRFNWLNDVLGERKYLTGEDFTIADAYAYTIIGWSDLHKVDLSSWKNIQAYLRRIEEMPSVQAAKKAEAMEIALRNAQSSAVSGS